MRKEASRFRKKKQGSPFLSKEHSPYITVDIHSDKLSAVSLWKTMLTGLESDCVYIVIKDLKDQYHS